MRLRYLAVLLLACCGPVPEEEFQSDQVTEALGSTLMLYVAKNGNDTTGGTSASMPAATLNRALALATAARQTADRPVTVLIAPGTYYAQSIGWSSFSATYPTTFAPSGEPGSVVFDGRANASEAFSTRTSFMTFEPSRPGPSNIVIRDLVVTNYLEGINFLANRNSLAANISGNRVLRTHFRRIGNLYAHVPKPDGSWALGMAVIRLVNTSQSEFLGNVFDDINNERGGGQHAYYLASNSSRNLIEGNTIRNHQSGAPIKLRDNSNENTIRKTRFVNVAPQAIQVWHCEVNARGDCTKATPECRSWGNTETMNVFENSPKYEVFSFSNYACGPTLLKPELTVDSTFYTGVIARFDTGGSSVFGVCASANDCVNRSGTCYQSDSGSDHALCFKREWARCGLDAVGKRVGEHVCQLTQNQGDATWVRAPAASYPIASVTSGGSVLSGACSRATSCLNASEMCFADDSGSAHSWCDQQDWQSCSLASLEKTSGHRVCAPTARDVNGRFNDAVWVQPPAGRFFIGSNSNGTWSYGSCSAPNSCVNPSGVCYAHGTGSPHALCDLRQWRSCGKGNVGQVYAGKRCSLVSGDPQWVY